MRHLQKSKKIRRIPLYEFSQSEHTMQLTPTEKNKTLPLSYPPVTILRQANGRTFTP